MPFLDSLDIANRALQHCGVNPILSVTEDTTNNNEVSAVYDKVRRAELRRNAWRFAIRKTVIRPMTSTTLEIAPSLYNSAQTYMQGELVTDSNNLIWISTAVDNIGNTPGGNNNAWDMFFGPMTADVWQPPANGAVTAWSAVVTYQVTSRVIGTDGFTYVSTFNNNLNNNPVGGNGIYWQKVGTFNSPTTYMAGELVYVANFRSNQFFNSSNLLNTSTWTQISLTVATSTVTDPLGGLTAVTLTDNVTNTNHFVQQQQTLIVGNTYTWTVYAKPGNLNSVALNYGGGIIYLFNASTGVITQNLGSATTSMTAIGNGWYRCQMTFVATSSTGFNYEMVNASNAISYAGGTGTINIWGPQLDVGSSAQVYNATPPLAQGYSLFMSLINNNADTPNVAQAWNASAQYMQDSIVNYAGFNWRSLLPYNVGNTPAVPPAAWNALTAYVSINTVVGSDNFIYSATGNTTGNNPVTDAGVHWTNTGALAAWTNTPTIVLQDLNWRSLSCLLKNAFVSWPVGSGPVTQTATRNVYRLPAGYVGPAPQNPKQGYMAWLGGPTGNNEPDWEYDGNFITSVWSQPIILRFVADITKVTVMDDMFCEGLAARIAEMVCKRVTGSGELTSQIGQAYKLFMGEARLKNGIENGPTETYEDEYVTIRI